ncbi:MAG TPA: AsmA family protein [Candidatus Acidoferrum sp.]|nr:AsmA family protein [Candidatus Acidoferrum sp.]
MARFRKYWKLGAALLLLVLVAQFGLNLVLRIHRVRQSMIARLERAFGRRVEVQSFTVALLPPGLDAEGITVGEDPAFGNEYFLRADRLSARLRLLGLLRGHFEFGTLSLDHPSLILVKNAEGRWNLERWLPPATLPDANTSKSAVPKPPDTPAARLAKIDITDGRLNFKIGDDKKPFAFIAVKGSIEQVAFGRWQINLEAQPWRSGVQLQSTGTIEVRGEVAGTSVRLRPARLQIRWSEASLADLVRLVRGEDEGIRGLFDLEASAESGTQIAKPDSPPGEWQFSLAARASRIHRWDLTERADNPRVAANWKGRWLPADGTIHIDEMLFATPKSNLRGIASVSTLPETNFSVRIDSAGVQAADLLAWYRAFEPGVAEGVAADQYFTGGVTLSGWPLKLDAAAFSSNGGKLSIPGFAEPFRIGAVRGGMEKSIFVLEPASIKWNNAVLEKNSPKKNTEFPKGKPASSQENSLSVGLRHDFDSHEGGTSLIGQSENAADVLKAVAALGKQLNRGWEWTGQSAANLQKDWGKQSIAGWNGQIDFAKGELQIAGLNLPVRVKNASLVWRHGKKAAQLVNVDAFEGTWSGEISENTNDADIQPHWLFKLHADSFSAADLDRWAGPRARPNWLQRLLPSALGGSSGQNSTASDLMRLVNAEGEISVDSFELNKLKLKQLRSQASLRDLHLHLRNCQAQWAGGTLQGELSAAFGPKPSYEVKVQANGLNLAQVPLAGKVADRVAGTLAGSLALKTDGVGREALLDNLNGQGLIQLKSVEFRGWDVQASFSAGSPHAGASRWTDGDGFFHVSARSLEVNHLRLRSPQEEISLKGSISFGREADLTIENDPGKSKMKTSVPQRVMQISGPLEGPKVAIQNISAQQPGD